jgi:hypothetical protein
LLDSKTFVDIDLGIGNNFYDTIVIFANIIKDARRLDHAKRHRTEKKAWIGIDSAMATQMIGASTASLLADTGVIQGATAVAACSPLSVFAFASYLWSATAKSAKKLARAQKKVDLSYLLHDRIIKYQRYSAEITASEERFNFLTNAIARLEKTKEQGDSFNDDNAIKEKLKKYQKEHHKEKLKLEEKHKKVNSLKSEIDCLSKFCVDDTNAPKETDSLEKKENYQHAIPYISQQYQAIFNRPLEDEVFTLSQQKFAEQLQTNQKDKVDHRMISTISLAIGALGMTMIGLGLIFPPLMVPGVLLCAASSLLKVSDLIVNKTMNFCANKKIKQQFADKIHEEYEKTNSLSLVPKFLDKKAIPIEAKIKWHLSFCLSKESLIKKLNFKFPDETQTKQVEIANQYLESTYYQSLKQMPAKQREKLLNLAFEKTIENKIIHQILGDGSEKITLVDKDKKALITRYCRSRYEFFSTNKTDSLSAEKRSASIPDSVDNPAFAHA